MLRGRSAEIVILRSGCGEKGAVFLSTASASFCQRIDLTIWSHPNRIEPCRYKEDLIRIIAVQKVQATVRACRRTTWASEDEVLEVSVGDQRDQSVKELGDACDVRDTAGDDGVIGNRRSRGDSLVTLQ